MKTRSSSLFPPVNRDTATLALRPLLIAGMVTPVHDGDGGVNIAMRDDYPAGLLCAIDPYPNMAVGDKHEIFWGDLNKVAQRDVEVGDLDKRLFIYLPTPTIVPDWGDPVFFRLTRSGSTTAEDAVALRLRVKLDRPAGIDKDPHLPGHSELQKPGLPQDVIDNGIDAEWAAKGVPVEIQTYPGRAAYDTIQLKWGSFTLIHEVSESEAAGTASITIMVDQAAILAAGDSDRLLVHYQVFDEVWNFSSAWSLQTYVEVDAGAWRLDAPIVKEAQNGKIDLIALGKNDATVQIAMQGSPYAVGDSITMTWIGTPATGLPVTHTERVTITSVPGILELKVPNADVRAIAQGSADASYVLTKANGEPPQSSKRRFVDVIGDISLLPAPTVLELVGEVLEPDTPVATVLIPAYPGMANGDYVNMIWYGMKSNGTPYIHEQSHTVTGGEVGKVISLPVPNEHIVVLDYGTLDLYYTVANDKKSLFGVSESDHAWIKVEQTRAELPAPKVVEAPDAVLDPALVPYGATLLVDYAGTAPGDELSWYWSGKPGDGTASDWVPITTPTAGKPITFRIASTLVTANIGSIVRVRYSLKRKATGQYSYSATLNLTIGSVVGKLPVPLVVEAPTGVLDPMNATAGVVVKASYEDMDPELDRIGLKWRGTPGAGSSEDLEQPANSAGYVDFNLPASVVGPNIGKSVDVSYEVQRYGTWNPSDILKLTVSNFKDPATELPLPRITQANDVSKELILDSFIGNASVTVGKWPFSAASQRVWLRLAGTGSAGVVTISLLEGVAISASQATSGLNETIIRTELEKLTHNTALTVTCSVTFDGAAQETTAIAFPIARYTFKTFDDSVKPTIDSVRDSQGEVTHGGTTFDTSVTLAGKAAAGQKVEIFDGAVSKGQATVNATGDWTLAVTGLATASHNMTAKALYGSGPVSTARTFTVAAATVPTITSVRDSKGEVANGGSTTDSYVTVTGTALASQQVQVLDNGANKGTAAVNANGVWSLQITGLGLGAHSVTAKGLYGSQPVSGSRSFTVRQATPPLNFDTTPVTLPGRVYIYTRDPNILPNFGSTTSIRRQPNGGVLPYTYSSSNPGVAVVDGAGLVTVRGNGSASISVRDSVGQTASFSVTVTGVIKFFGLGNGKWDAMNGAASAAGGRLPNMAELREIHAEYGSRWFMGADYYWSSDKRGGIVIPHYFMKRFPDGQEAYVEWYGFHSAMALL